MMRSLSWLWVRHFSINLQCHPSFSKTSESVAVGATLASNQEMGLELSIRNDLLVTHGAEFDV